MFVPAFNVTSGITARFPRTMNVQVEASTPPYAVVPTSIRPDTDVTEADFAKYNVVVSNYNGAPWPEATRKAFIDYVKGGGGFVVVR